MDAAHVINREFPCAAKLSLSRDPSALSSEHPPRFSLLYKVKTTSSGNAKHRRRPYVGWHPRPRPHRCSPPGRVTRQLRRRRACVVRRASKSSTPASVGTTRRRPRRKTVGPRVRHQVLARAWGCAKRVGQRGMWIVGADLPSPRRTPPAAGGHGEKDAAPAVKTRIRTRLSGIRPDELSKARHGLNAVRLRASLAMDGAECGSGGGLERRAGSHDVAALQGWGSSVRYDAP